MLEKNREAVDALNVFPVPDGDTGTNMSLTMMSATKEISNKEYLIAGEAANALARGALRGARGNSGVILPTLVILTRSDMISLADVTPRYRRSHPEVVSTVTFPVGAPMVDVQRRHVLTTLASHSGDIAKTASVLGVVPDDVRRELQALLASGMDIVDLPQELTANGTTSVAAGPVGHVEGDPPNGNGSRKLSARKR
jgi:hypothetical protein